MTALHFTVYGTPAPQGSHKAFVRGKRAIITNDSAKTRPWREDVKQAALAARGDTPPIEGPVHVVVCFTLAKPASAPKRRKVWPSKRPDIDKLLRSTFDAIGEAGVWKDDAQVVVVVARKSYPDEHTHALDTPGARISVGLLDEAA